MTPLTGYLAKRIDAEIYCCRNELTATYVQNALKLRKYNMNDEDFPLRRWLKCAICGRDLKGSKARSRSGTRHSYYHCHNKKCPKYGKGIRQHDLHEDFENLLGSFAPPSGIINLANAIIQDKISTESK